MSTVHRPPSGRRAAPSSIRAGMEVDPEKLLDGTLRHLGALVAFDTRNPPRALDGSGIFDYLASHLPGFRCRLTDHGAGAVSLHAVRGKPHVLFNVHIDTVPDSPHWSASPFELRIEGDHVLGLGACDIKGAAAALLAVAGAGEGDAAFLFTSDEEANDPRCVAAFLEQRLPYDAVVVAEPTCCRAVLAHRGISSVAVRFRGRAGHASGAQQPEDSALHQAMRWGSRALAHADALAGERFDTLSGLRFNIGRVEGGIKANVVAPEAEVRFNVRPLPSMDSGGLLADLHGLADPRPAEFCETFRGPPLPAGDSSAAQERRHAAAATAGRLGLPVGPAVDFWTEASLFSRAGYTSFVYGPGDIAQAHAADEWVAIDQLRQYAASISRIIDP